MAKSVNPAVLDGALNIVATATRMVAVAGEPTTYAAADSGRLAESSLTAEKTPPWGRARARLSGPPQGGGRAVHPPL